MTKHFQREIDALKRKLLTLSSRVEDLVFKAVKAVEERDSAIAEQVQKSDNEIDIGEVEVEEDCLKLLALYQPVAVDLRVVIGVLKINNDLERIGDLACNIAERALSLSRHKKVSTIFPFNTMANKVKQMLHESLVAFVNLDIELAKSVCTADREVDQVHREIHQLIEASAKSNPEEIHLLLYCLSVSRCLERIADHATNIAEDVIYIVEGEIVRHPHRLESPLD